MTPRILFIALTRIIERDVKNIMLAH